MLREQPCMINVHTHLVQFVFNLGTSFEQHLQNLDIGRLRRLMHTRAPVILSTCSHNRLLKTIAQTTETKNRP